MARSDMQMANELMALRSENRRLRYQNEDLAAERARARSERLIERTYRDAQALLAMHFAWQPTTRADAHLSHRRWTYAVAMLKAARLADHRARYLRIKASDPARAMAKLSKARDTALADPSSLRVMMPASRRPNALNLASGNHGRR